MVYDAEKETGQDAPIRLVIEETGSLLVAIRETTPEAALTTALCLLEGQHQSEDRQDPMALAIAEAAQILNDAAVLVAETEAARPKRYRLMLTDEEQSSEVEVWSFNAAYGPDAFDLRQVVDAHELSQYSLGPME